MKGDNKLIISREAYDVIVAKALQEVMGNNVRVTDITHPRWSGDDCTIHFTSDPLPLLVSVPYSTNDQEAV